MIGAFGFPTEPEPGVLHLAGQNVRGVHITRLLRDGSGKTGDPSKIIIGKCPGVPIVLAAPNDLNGLVIGEGIEDVASTCHATGLGGWAAGAAGRLPALAAAVPSYIEAVSVVQDNDPAGRKGAEELVDGLRPRGIEARPVILARARQATA
jgi:hypothetical protein